MKPRTPGFWLIVATVGLLALLPMSALAGMTPEEVKLFRETKAKADQGDVQAQNSLGLCYYFGRGVAKDDVQAVNLWRKGANQGDAYAQHLLAHRYATGEGVAKDSQQAVSLWRKSAAQGNAKAQFELGNCYLTGEGVVKDPVEAAKWYRKSADQGYAAAAQSLDLLNRKTPGKGTPATETTVTTLDGARVVITKKGNVTNVETVAMSPQVKWYRKGAEQGDAQAQFNLGFCYTYGEGVAKDHVEAAKWYRKAAEQGKASAQFNLGGCYAEGEGVAQDLDEAAKWYRKAAEQGYDGAKYHLNRLNDEVEAVKGYRKGAEKGDPKAQFNLGNSYHLGRGVAKDAVEAAKWYRKAAEQGHAEAAESLDSLNRMTPSKGTPATETTVTTLDGARVVITKKGNVTNVETVGNLSPNTALTGSTLEEIKPENNPVDLLARAVELFPQNQRAAYQLGLAARLRAQFDQKRVADRTAQQAFSVLTMQPANERVLSWGGGSQTIGAEDHRAVLEWARKSGPPTYHPAWMIQHGMGAFGASSRVGAGLNAGFVAASAWSQVLEDYAKFIDTPSFWVTRHERNNPANFPTLLKGMESRYLSELNSGPAGEIGRQKLRAVVVDFDLKAADPALALLDARDTMQAIVAAPKSVVPASAEPAKVPTPQVIKTMAEQRDAYAQYRMGYRYANGDGVEKNLVESLKWYRQAAENGQVEAQYRLGFIYEQGKGVPVDYVESASWWRKAADQGHAGAQFSLGYCYGRGEGVPRSPSEAVKWFRKSADQGNASACRFLGIAYERGQGVGIDKVEAYAYLTIALSGDSYARGELDSMTRGMTPNAIEKGKQRTKELQKEIEAKIAAKKAGK